MLKCIAKETANVVFVLLVVLGCACMAQENKKGILAEDLSDSRGLVKLIDCEKSLNGQFVFNNWKGKFNWDISKDQTPVKSPAYKISATEEKGPSALHINAHFMSGQEWCNKKYTAVSFWFKGSGENIRIRFALSDTGGKSIQKMLNLSNNQWQKVKIPVFEKTGGFNLSKINLVSFKVNSNAEFSFSDIILELGERDIFLTRCKSVVIPEINKAPVLNGVIDDTEWKNAGNVDDFVSIKSNNESPKMKTEVKLAHDGEKLYYASKLYYDDMKKVSGFLKLRDDPVYQEDDFEIFVDANCDSYTFNQFAFGFAGGIFDMKRYYDIDLCLYKTSVQWNAKGIVAENTRTKDSVDFEIAIPFTDVDLDIAKNPYSGLQLSRANISCGEYSSWSPTSKFPLPKNYGVMVYEREQKSAFKFSDICLSEIEVGKYVISGVINNSAEERDVDLKIVLNTPPEKILEEKQQLKLLPGLNSFRKVLDVPAITEGSHRLALLIDSDKKETPEVAVFALNVTVPVNVEFGEITFNPEPREVNWGKDKFKLLDDLEILIAKNSTERTRKTADYLSQEIFGHAGMKLPVNISDDKKMQELCMVIVMDSLVKKLVNQKEEDLSMMKPEGYNLTIKPEGIILKGKDEAGLYYSVVTLLQMLAAPQVRLNSFEIPCVKINDWPDLKYRANVNYFGGMCRNRQVTRFMQNNPKEKMAFFKDYIKTFVAGNKYNMLSLSPGATYKWEKNPKLQNNAFIDKNDLKKIAEFCKDHFVEFVPGLNLAGHDPFFFHRAFPDLREKGYIHMADIENPKFKKIVIDCLEELTEACNPKIFDISHDEFWHRRKRGEEVTESSKPKKEIFYEEIMLHYNYLKKKGIKMMMYGDMLIPEHHGDRFDCYTIADKLPKDIFIKNWSASGFRTSSKYLKGKGFENIIDTLNGYVPLPGDNGIISGFGCISYGGFTTTTQTFTTDGHGVNYCFHGWCRAADYAWNFAHDNQMSISGWRRNKMLNLLSVYAFKANPFGANKFEPVDISAQANESASDDVAGDKKGWFDLGPDKSCGDDIKTLKEAGMIPVSVKDNSEGNNIILLNKDCKVVEIPINKKYAGFTFLHTCNYPKNTKEEKNNFRKRSRNYVYGTTVGVYTINYADGTNEKADMNYGNTILEWMPYAPARFIQGCRYVWAKQLQCGERGCLYQQQWVNPCPEKIIKSITISKENTEADVAVVAITGEMCR